MVIPYFKGAPSVSGGAGLVPPSFAKPQQPPRNVTPPAVRTTAPHPNHPLPRVNPGGIRQGVAPPRASVPRVQPSRAPAKAASTNTGINYGLPTGGALTREAFNPFGMPKTMSQFNQEVNQTAAPSYEPQLQQNAAEVDAENAANTQRNADINSIYSQEGTQTQQAFNDTQKALTDIIAQENTGNGQAGQVLSAALASANNPQSELATSLGLTPSPANTAAEVAPYSAAATAAANSGQQAMAGLSGSEMEDMGQEVAGTALDEASQLNAESQRHGAAIQSLTGNKDAIIAQIPSIIEQARTQLLTDLQSSQSLQFQEQLANQQFGVTKATANANIKNAAGQLSINKTNAAANRANAAAQLQQNSRALTIQAQKIQEANTAAQAKLQLALATAQGKQQANAIKFLQSWVMPTKQEIIPAHKDPNTGAEVPQQINAKIWHRDAGNALKTLMSTYGLNLRDALGLMSSLTTPIGGPGSGTIGQWASSFLQRAAQQRMRRGIPGALNNPLSPVPPGTTKKSSLGSFHRG